MMVKLKPGPPTIAPPTVVPPVTDDPNAPTFTPGSLRKRRDAEFIEPAAAHFSCFRIRVPGLMFFSKYFTFIFNLSLHSSNCRADSN